MEKPHSQHEFTWTAAVFPIYFYLAALAVQRSRELSPFAEAEGLSGLALAAPFFAVAVVLMGSLLCRSRTPLQFWLAVSLAIVFGAATLYLAALWHT